MDLYKLIEGTICALIFTVVAGILVVSGYGMLQQVQIGPTRAEQQAAALGESWQGGAQ
jgi:hypothetical protein